MEHKYIFIVYHVSERMLKTELYCVTKNFYPLTFILGDKSYRKYILNPEKLAEDMIIDPKRRVFILEEEVTGTIEDEGSIVEENLLDIGLKNSLRLDQITTHDSKYELHP